MTKVFVHVHIFYPEKWPEIKDRLGSIQGVSYDLYVTFVREDQELCDDILAFKSEAKLELVENRGYDVGPFMHVLRKIDLNAYDYVIKLHTKRDVVKGSFLKAYPVSGARWRELALSFLQTPQTFQSCLDVFAKDPSLGMCANHRLIIRSKPEVRLELKSGLAYLAQMGLPQKRGAFVAGTMFMVRASLFAPFLPLGYDLGDFAVPVRGEPTSRAHVFERLFGWVVEAQGYKLYDAFTDRREQNYVRATCFARKVMNFFYRSKVTCRGRKIIKICKVPIYVEKKRDGSMYRLIDFQVRGDEKGSLIALEGRKDIPFDVKRVFYIYGTADHIVRGNHANRLSQFVLIALNGSCKVKIRKPEGDEVIDLDRPDKGLWLDKLVWKEMYDFTQDSILLVFSDQYYDAGEYIHDYDLFLKESGHVAPTC